MLSLKKYIKLIGKILILFMVGFTIIIAVNQGIYYIFQKIYLISNSELQISKEQLNLITNQSPWYLALMSLSSILFTVFLFGFVKKVDKKNMNDIFFNKSCSQNIKMFLWGAIIALITIFIFIAFGVRVGILEYISEQSIDVVNGKFIAFFISGLVFSFITGFYEEIFFRGYILNEFLNLDRRYALIISAFIFMLSEMSGTFRPIDLFGTFLAGIFLGYLYISTSSLFITAGVHSMLHLLLLNVVTLHKYDYGIPTLFTFSSHGTFKLFDIEMATASGICTVFVNLLSIVLVYIYNKKFNKSYENEIKLIGKKKAVESKNGY